MRILIITHIPSPYQVELFDKIAASELFSLHIVYLHVSTNDRLWTTPKLRHDHTIVEKNKTNYLILKEMIQTFDLVIFNYYQHPIAQILMQNRAKEKSPWCYWGERPGYHQWGVLGRVYRRWKLFHLLHSNVPIWGIGEWAINEYRREFGSNRLYLNYSYFSDLERFKTSRKQTRHHSGSIKFLYSGALIKRKGVDILAKAFIRLAKERSNVQLDIMGHGPLDTYLKDEMKNFNYRVRFLGFQQWESIPQYYWDADILCVPSRYDGWGLVVPEGLATGLPVISTNRTGAALELIKPNWNGWLVNTDNANELYDAMQEAVMLSPANLKFYSDNAKSSITNYSLEAGVKRFNQCVEATMNTCETL